MSFSLAVIALGFGIAGLADDTVRVWMKSWERQRQLGDVSQWDQAYSRLRVARRLNPLNADYSANLGHLMAWRAWSQLPGSREHAEDRANAERMYLKSIGVRPGWGYAWASFAEIQLLQGNSGAEFVHALEMAIIQAPWEPWVQKKVAWMGMATWEDLPNPTREMVSENIRRTVILGRFPDEIIRIAAQYDWLEHLRPMLQTERQLDTAKFVHKQLEAQW